MPQTVFTSRAHSQRPVQAECPKNTRRAMAELPGRHEQKPIRTATEQSATAYRNLFEFLLVAHERNFADSSHTYGTSPVACSKRRPHKWKFNRSVLRKKTNVILPNSCSKRRRHRWKFSKRLAAQSDPINGICPIACNKNIKCGFSMRLAVWLSHPVSVVIILHQFQPI